MHRIVAILVSLSSPPPPDGYDICEFNSLRGQNIDIIDRVPSESPALFSVSIYSIGKTTEPCISTNKQQVIDTRFWQFLEPSLTLS